MVVVVVVNELFVGVVDRIVVVYVVVGYASNCVTNSIQVLLSAFVMRLRERGKFYERIMCARRVNSRRVLLLFAAQRITFLFFIFYVYYYEW